ncbi:hypothetical protein G9P44_000572 [Scheffersomyces stipitis]|nr:hypothetical protein G9P44_000572 [Scheffersomyces stipitis]
MSKYPEDTPDLPPPTYEEAISEQHTGVSSIAPPHPPRPKPNHLVPPLPNRRTSNSSTNSSSGNSYNSQSNSYGGSGSGVNSSSGTSRPKPDLYSANSSLPFKYERGYLCSKCKNSGYKVKNGRLCRDCWDKFYLRKNAYNPNPDLPFKYPVKYFCDKCNNTGYKLKNGKSCKDCWELFSPRNRVGGSSSYGRMNITSPPVAATAMGGFGPMAPMMVPPVAPLRVPPGDPRLGGVPCGRCRGTGMITFLLDQDLCPVCRGLGRVIHGPPRAPMPPPQHYQQPFAPPPPHPSRPQYPYGKS